MAALVASRVVVPTFSGLKAQASRKVAPVSATPVTISVAPVASLKAETLRNIGKALVAGVATLALTGSANAALIKMGADDGALKFVPSSLTVSAGESVTFKNNAGYPHNVVFDEDAVPGGVNADSISHEDYFNGPGEEYTVIFSKAGTYEYYCEPHQGAGMAGSITVS